MEIIITSSNTVLLQISFFKLGAKYLSPVLIPNYEVVCSIDKIEAVGIILVHI